MNKNSSPSALNTPITGIHNSICQQDTALLGSINHTVHYSKVLLWFVVALFMAFGSVVSHAEAQSKKSEGEKPMTKKEQKAEIKKWRKKAKSYKKNPLALKAREEAFQKEVEALNKKNNEQQKKISELEADLAKCACAKPCQDELADLKTKMGAMKTQMDSLKGEFDRLQTAYEATKGIAPASPTKAPETAPGLFFRVQIGAYEKFKINKHLTNTDDNFTGESADNLNKYLVGKFKNYTLAEAFKKDIQKLGIKDAWVVAYNDGVRIEVKEALKLQNSGK